MRTAPSLQLWLLLPAGNAVAAAEILMIARRCLLSTPCPLNPDLSQPYLSSLHRLVSAAAVVEQLQQMRCLQRQLQLQMQPQQQGRSCTSAIPPEQQNSQQLPALLLLQPSPWQVLALQSLPQRESCLTYQP
jgi:hypothetical protein